MSEKIVWFDKRYYLIIIAVIAGGSLLIYLLLDDQKDVANSFADQIISECGKDFECAYGYLIAIAEKEDQSTVMATFDDIISSYESSKRYCHTHAHHLGMFLYDYFGDLDEAFSHADQRCAGAIYHGVVLRFFMTSVNKTNLADIDVGSICPKTVDDPYTLTRWECLHGIGHGLTNVYNFDVFSAVRHCEDLEPGWEQISCSKGVFMGNVVHYLEIQAGTFDENDIFYPCNAVDAKFRPTCYNYHASYILAKNRFSIGNSFKQCDRIVPEEFVKYCYFGMGRQLSFQALDDMGLALPICTTGQPAYQSYCFTGIALVILDLKGTDQAFQYCNLLPEQFKVDCYDAVGKWIRMLYPTDKERESECSKAESSDYFEVCVNANFEGITIL